MTLETVARYDPDRLSRNRGHAVVVGASVAGLCAARVLSDAFERVTVLERDDLPEAPVARSGVPHGSHVHSLQEAGRATVEDLFPGFCEDVVADGGVLLDGSRDLDYYAEDGFLADGRRSRPVVAATRPLYEQHLRRQVHSRERITIRTNCRFTDFLLNESEAAVQGVVVQTDQNRMELVDAQLVVDAMGRTSHTAAWLEDREYPAPTVDTVTIDCTAATTVVDRPSLDRRAFVILPSPDRPRGASVLPVEEQRWVLTLWGMHGTEAPANPAEFADFADRLPVPHVHRLLAEHQWNPADITTLEFPTSLRRRYEAVTDGPDGLVVVGDAIASINPVYGQGMSVAALEALHLHHALAADGTGSLPRRYFQRVSKTVDSAWQPAVCNDHRFSQTVGSEPRWAAFSNWYRCRLLEHAHTDATLADAFLDVQSMVRPPSSLREPGIAWRVLTP